MRCQLHECGGLEQMDQTQRPKEKTRRPGRDVVLFFQEGISASLLREIVSLRPSTEFLICLFCTFFCILLLF